MAKKIFFTPNVRIVDRYVGNSMPKPLVSKSVPRTLSGGGLIAYGGTLDSGEPINNVWGNSPTEIWGESPSLAWGM